MSPRLRGKSGQGRTDRDTGLIRPTTTRLGSAWYGKATSDAAPSAPSIDRTSPAGRPDIASPATVDDLESIPTGPDRPLMHLYAGRGSRRVGAPALCGWRCTRAELAADFRKARACGECARIGREQFGVDLDAYLRERAGR